MAIHLYRSPHEKTRDDCQSARLTQCLDLFSGGITWNSSDDSRVEFSIAPRGYNRSHHSSRTHHDDRPSSSSGRMPVTELAF